MLNKIAKFIDFDPNRQGAGAIIEEFNHKYKESWLLVDGKPTLIHKFSFNGENFSLTMTPLGKMADQYLEITTIEPFVPKTGLYGNKDGLIYLHRLPQRQWTKGFCLNKNYISKTLVKRDGIRDINVIKHLTHNETQYAAESIIHSEKVFLHWKRVGDFKLDTGKIHLKNNVFLKELQELWPQLPITLDAVHQSKPMEEKLILDF